MKIIITADMSGKTVKEIIKRNKVSTRLLAKLKTLDDGICVNGEKRTVRHVVKENDILTLKIEDTEKSPNITESPIPIDVIWEDEWYIAVAKPAHLPTHPARHHQGDTLASRVAYLLRDRNFVFRALTRLDLDTSGAVIIAKNQLSANEFSKMLIRREVKKEYLAVCRGKIAVSEGCVDKPIYRPDERSIVRCTGDTGEEALTLFKVLKTTENESLVSVFPVTGRTHQIRVHMKAIGHPIVGDTLYSIPSPLIDRQALHAHRISFTHPFTKEEVTVECPLFNDMESMIKNTFGE